MTTITKVQHAQFLRVLQVERDETEHSALAGKLPHHRQSRHFVTPPTG
jgi:hypothetical protein